LKFSIFRFLTCFTDYLGLAHRLLCQNVAIGAVPYITALTSTAGAFQNGRIDAATKRRGGLLPLKPPGSLLAEAQAKVSHKNAIVQP
jgi:hypothetical protein